jgi:hypothetical protein
MHDFSSVRSVNRVKDTLKLEDALLICLNSEWDTCIAKGLNVLYV